MLDYFIFGEFDSRNFGLKVFSDDSFNAKMADFKSTKRLARNGAIFSDFSKFDARTKKYTCILLNCENPSLVLSELRSIFLMNRSSEEKLEDSAEKEFFYYARVNSDFTIKKNYRDRDFIFSISFSVQPQRFLKSGEIAIENPSILINHTKFQSYPIIELTTTSESGYIKFKGETGLEFFDLPLGTNFIFDAENLDARNDLGESLNNRVFVKEDVFIDIGENPVYSSGVSDVKIIPRWWTI